MKIQNITKIISAIIGVLAAFFLLRIIGTGDDDIKMYTIQTQLLADFDGDTN